MSSKPSSVAMIALTVVIGAIAILPILLRILGGGLQTFGAETKPLAACKQFKQNEVSATVRIVLPLDGNPIGAVRTVLQRIHADESVEFSDDGKLLDALKSGTSLSEYGDPNTSPGVELSYPPFQVYLDGLKGDMTKGRWAQIRVIATDASKYRFTRVLDGTTLNGVGFSSGNKRFICWGSAQQMPEPITIHGLGTGQTGEVAVFYGEIGTKNGGAKKVNGFNFVYEAPLSDTPVIVDPKIRNNG